LLLISLDLSLNLSSPQFPFPVADVFSNVESKAADSATTGEPFFLDSPSQSQSDRNTATQSGKDEGMILTICLH
jgi:hypothetical protein